MYEYLTTTYHGTTLPSSLAPPEGGFRFRDAKFTETSRSINNSVSFSGNNMPYILNRNENSIGQWVVIWERYVSQEGN